jgi:hypothetical protein
MHAWGVRAHADACDARAVESAGEAGAVHCSRVAWDLAGLPDALGAPRLLRVKGKAEEMETLLLDAAAPHAAEAARRLQAACDAADAAAASEQAAATD